MNQHEKAQMKAEAIVFTIAAIVLFGLSNLVIKDQHIAGFINLFGFGIGLIGLVSFGKLAWENRKN